MMELSPRLILGYLHHDRAVRAGEQLDAFSIASLPWAKPTDQRRELDRLQRAADGEEPQTSAEAAAQRKALWDAEWARLRGRLGGARPAHGALRPGERIVIPAE